MQIEIDPYRHHLAALDLSEAQQAEIIRALHLVMESFVDLAFGLDATQISLGTDDDFGRAGPPFALDLPPLLPPTFNDAAIEPAAGKTAHAPAER